MAVKYLIARAQISIEKIRGEIDDHRFRAMGSSHHLKDTQKMLAKIEDLCVRVDVVLKKAHCKIEAQEEMEATQWLKERGYEQGEDYEYEDVVRFANRKAFEEEVKRAQALGEFHEFTGADNCEDCKGWDGVSDRCECGNRRVMWATLDSHSFKHPCIYGEAY